MRVKYSGADRLILDRRVENRAMLDVYLGVIEQRFVAVTRDAAVSPAATEALLREAETAATGARALADAARALRAGVGAAQVTHEAAVVLAKQAAARLDEATRAVEAAEEGPARQAAVAAQAQRQAERDAARAEAARLEAALAAAQHEAETPEARVRLTEADRRATEAQEAARLALEAWEASRLAGAGGLEIVAEIVARYRLSKRDAEANPHRTPDPELPSWSEAYMAEKILVRHAAIASVRTDLARRLVELQDLDPRAHGVLQNEVSEAAGAGALEFARRAPAILVSALDQIEWVNAKKMIVRQLAGLYAARVSTAFALVLLIALALVLSEIFLRSHVLPAGVASAPGLSGLGFAVAAGIIGASFSAMTRQSAVSGLTRIEDVRTAVSWAMIQLRIGVGLGAAVIVYFAFDAGLIAGDLFPNLDRLGFGRVDPAADAVAESGAAARDFVSAAGDLRGVIGDLSATMASGGAATPAAMAEALDRLKQIEAPMTLAALKAPAATSPLGLWAPNADLCKLVIWCFIAGFAEKFVPDLLAKAQARMDAAR